ncbi:hypothetical protein T440DRAFT_467336 [Plenodomus tracheiphilus IPT5]|uniref:Uncharacterized protein n=1 Tax=Plenodomus tracheiphilus IPT5 TaxID=1408161 RepID=A0A6A7BCL3_9PLEO|nr:hypothetical protein T440DRAFT_467336 [Plenodomus tracheiphilus IPT5]
MKSAGFEAVDWSDGKSPELKTVRLITAFPRAKATSSDSNGVAVANGVDSKLSNGAEIAANVKTVLETVVYKTVGDQDIHADVY